MQLTKSKQDKKSAELANQILENYQPDTVEDMQNALKDIFGSMFESMLKGEMTHHLGYESNDKTDKETENKSNDYEKKPLKQVLVKWTLRCQAIVTAPIIQS